MMTEEAMPAVEAPEPEAQPEATPEPDPETPKAPEAPETPASEPESLGNVPFDRIAARAGIDVVGAKAKVVAMGETFSANEGGIPGPARQRLVDELFPANVRDRILLGIIDEWARG